MPALASSKPKPAVMILGIGGLLLVVGSLLPFFSLSIDVPGFSDSQTFGGLDTDDGKFYIAFGIILLVFAGVLAMSKSSTMRRVFAVLGVLLAAFSTFAAFVDISGAEEAAQAAFDDAAGVGALGLDLNLDYSTGIGLYIVAVGSILAVAGSLLALFKPGDEQVMPVTGPPEPPSGAGAPPESPPSA